MTALAKDVTALAGIFAASGVLHLARPEVYEPLMPGFVPAQREVIYASGVAAPSDSTAVTAGVPSGATYWPQSEM